MRPKEGWQGWEYRLLAEGHPDAKTAGLLGRPEEEVRQRADRMSGRTLQGWYARRRCQGAPEDPERLMALGRKVAREDFPEVADDAVESHVWEAVSYTLDHFDPHAGDQAVPLERRFLGCFRVWLRQHLSRERRKRRRQARPRLRLLPPSVLAEVAAPEPPREGAAESYESWSHLLYELALDRVDARTRAALELRQQGQGPAAIAARLTLSIKTVANRYSEARLAAAVRQRVRGVVLGLAVRDRVRLVAYLARVVRVRPDEVGMLLCLPPEQVDGLMAAAEVGEPPLAPDEAWAMVGRPQRAAWAA